MKKFRFLSILIAVFMLGACTVQPSGNNYGDNGEPGGGEPGGGEPGGSGEGEESLWPEEIKEQMLSYFGETLPYVELNEETIYSGYSDEYESDVRLPAGLNRFKPIHINPRPSCPVSSFWKAL